MLGSSLSATAQTPPSPQTRCTTYLLIHGLHLHFSDMDDGLIGVFYIMPAFNFHIYKCRVFSGRKATFGFVFLQASGSYSSVMVDL